MDNNLLRNMWTKSNTDSSTFTVTKIPTISYKDDTLTLLCGNDSHRMETNYIFSIDSYTIIHVDEHGNKRGVGVVANLARDTKALQYIVDKFHRDTVDITKKYTVTTRYSDHLDTIPYVSGPSFTSMVVDEIQYEEITEVLQPDEVYAYLKSKGIEL